MESSQLKTFWALFYKDVVAFKLDYVQSLLDNLFWSLAIVTPALFFLPAMGMPSDFGIFLMICFSSVREIVVILFSAKNL